MSEISDYWKPELEKAHEEIRRLGYRIAELEAAKQPVSMRLTPVASGERNELRDTLACLLFIRDMVRRVSPGLDPTGMTATQLTEASQIFAVFERLRAIDDTIERLQAHPSCADMVDDRGRLTTSQPQKAGNDE